MSGSASETEAGTAAAYAGGTPVVSADGLRGLRAREAHLVETAAACPAQPPRGGLP
jgi:hypothetical protein